MVRAIGIATLTLVTVALAVYLTLAIATAFEVRCVAGYHYGPPAQTCTVEVKR